MLLLIAIDRNRQDVSFLATNPDILLSDYDYTWLLWKIIAPKQHIVNDNAQRGVSFMQEVNALVTKDEEQTQCAV